MPSDKRRNADNAIEEGTTQILIIFIIEERDDMRQNNVVCFLASKKDTQLDYSRFHKGLPHN